ncbi:MAG: carbohydrate kinase [Phycisphaera sp.]|nr:carbohydrate kinase [Phycisphaera sp.]
MDPLHPRFTVVGLGEALFDIFPDAQVLGGAPLNVAVHAHQLAGPLGGRGVVVSRVGQDELGNLVIDELKNRGMTPDYLQADPDHDTGKVYVTLDARGQPSFEIVRNVAWDWLSFDPQDETLARQCEAVCFGSLAQREAQARNAIYRFLDTARRAVRLFDVNLRQDYFDRHILDRSLSMATACKLNVDELPRVMKLVHAVKATDAGDDAACDAMARALLEKYTLRFVALTRGERGTVIYDPQGRHEGTKASYPMQDRADAVGAGDACGAAILVGVLRRWPMKKVADLANRVGAYVASVPGATPRLPDDLLQMMTT